MDKIRNSTIFQSANKENQRSQRNHSRKTHRFFNTNRARAIAIIKNDCKIRSQESCSIQVSDLQECFESKCKSKLESEFARQETPWPKDIEPPRPQLYHEQNHLQYKSL